MNLKGFSTVEVLLASALFVIFTTGIIGAVVQGVSSNRLGNEGVVATQFASEGLDAVRSIKDRGFVNLTSVNSLPRAVTLTNGIWTFGADNTSNILAHSTTDNYVRQVTVEAVNRDAAPPNGNIVTSGGNIDPLTKKVTSTVTWNFTSARPESITLVEYLSDWGATIGPTPTSAPINATLSPIADAEVDSSPSTTNFGAASTMQIQNDSLIQQAYMMFDLTPYAGYTLSSASLRLQTANVASSGSPSTEPIFLVNNTTWTELGITYANKPAISATQIGTIPSTTDNTAYLIPLTTANVQALLGGKIAWAITSSSTDHALFNTKEAAAGKPQLVLNFSAGPAPTATPLPPTATPLPPTPTPTPPAWKFRKKITIDQTKVTGTSNLASFPVLISITDANLAANAQTNGNDIKFTSSDGVTKLDHEIEKYTSSTGQLIAWVRIPTLSPSVNTDIYMYYGNATAANQQNPTGVWDTNYIGVWHLSESGTSTRLDSTSKNNDATPINGTSGTTGKIGNGNNFTRASSQNLNIPNVANLQITGNITLEGWVNSNTISDGSNNVFLAKDGPTDGYKLSSPGSKIQFRLSPDGTSGSTVNGSTTLSNTTWYFIAGTYDKTTQKAYLNGVLDNSAANTANTATNTGPLKIGSRGDTANGSNWWDGKLDEIRVSNIARSADWLLTEYNNTNSPSTFYAVGAQEVL